MNLDEYFRFDHEVYLYGALFLKKNEQDITSYIGYFRPKDIDKIPYVWYYNYKYEFFNEYNYNNCNRKTIQ